MTLLKALDIQSWLTFRVLEMIADFVVQKQRGGGQGRGKDQEMERGKLLHIRNSVCSQTLPRSFQNVAIYIPRSWLPNERSKSQALESLDLSLNPRSPIHVSMLHNLSKPQFPHLKMGLIKVHPSQSCRVLSMQLMSDIRRNILICKSHKSKADVTSISISALRPLIINRKANYSISIHTSFFICKMGMIKSIL